MTCAWCEKREDVRVGLPYGWMLLEPGAIVVCSVACAAEAINDIRTREAEAWSRSS